MVGWKRIVITVGEKIGKAHLTYGQGAAAELTASATIAAADIYGLPVSTTHVLSSGIAGTMAANGSGLQWSTVRNLALAWVLNNRFITSVIGGPRTVEQWQDYLDALSYTYTAEDEALIDHLVPIGHPSTPGYNDPAYPLEGRKPIIG